MATSDFTQLESSVWVPTPSGTPVTIIWIENVGSLEVIEPFDFVIEALASRPFKFTDYFREPVWISATANVVAVAVGFKDMRSVELDMKERALSLEVRAKQLAVASLETRATRSVRS